MENLTEQQEKEWQEYEAERFYEHQEKEAYWYEELQKERNKALDNLRWEEEYGDDYL